MTQSDFWNPKAPFEPFRGSRSHFLVTFESFAKRSQSLCLPPPPAHKHYIHRKGASISGPLHHSHVIHCASRNYACKAYFSSAMDGVGHYIEESAELVITLDSCNGARAITERNSQRIICVIISLGVQSSALFC